jgi:hypothetical protein
VGGRRLWTLGGVGHKLGMRYNRRLGLGCQGRRNGLEVGYALFHDSLVRAVLLWLLRAWLGGAPALLPRELPRWRWL